MNNADAPINPQNYNQCGDNEFEPLIDGKRTGYEKKMPGLTKREYFAGLAMQGLLSSRKDPLYQVSDDTLDTFAKTSVKLANKLLKQLETTTNK